MNHQGLDFKSRERHYTIGIFVNGLLLLGFYIAKIGYLEKQLSKKILCEQKGQFKTIACSKGHQKMCHIAASIRSKAMDYFPISKYILYLCSHSGHTKNAGNRRVRLQ